MELHAAVTADSERLTSPARLQERVKRPSPTKSTGESLEIAAYGGIGGLHDPDQDLYIYS